MVFLTCIRKIWLEHVNQKISKNFYMLIFRRVSLNGSMKFFHFRSICSSGKIMGEAVCIPVKEFHDPIMFG
jgi:hypothetical protein